MKRLNGVPLQMGHAPVPRGEGPRRSSLLFFESFEKTNTHKLLPQTQGNVQLPSGSKQRRN